MAPGRDHAPRALLSPHDRKMLTRLLDDGHRSPRAPVDWVDHFAARTKRAAQSRIAVTQPSRPHEQSDHRSSPSSLGGDAPRQTRRRLRIPGRRRIERHSGRGASVRFVGISTPQGSAAACISYPPQTSGWRSRMRQAVVTCALNGVPAPTSHHRLEAVT